MVAAAWRERVQKAEDDYLAAASAAATPQQPQQAEGGRGPRSAAGVTAAPAATRRGGGGASGKRHGAGGQSTRGGHGHGGSARDGSGGVGDVDALACIGKEGGMRFHLTKRDWWDICMINQSYQRFVGGNNCKTQSVSQSLSKPVYQPHSSL